MLADLVTKKYFLSSQGFAQLLQKAPTATLWLAGDGPMKEFLKRQCQDLGIKDRVKFLGFLDHATLAKYYAACDVLFCPRCKKFKPLVLIEAMWFGKPVIAPAPSFPPLN